MKAIGLMSGTSMDGVDVALIETDGESIQTFGPAAGYRYEPPERQLLLEALDWAKGLLRRDDRSGVLAIAEALVTEKHANSVKAFAETHGIDLRTVDIVGFHGQTVIHRPDRGLTVQLGDGRSLSAALGVPVAYDFRAADIAAGGQGAPLVPIFHRALALRSGLTLPAAFVNIGGIANVTYVAEGGPDHLIAFDAGPGNCLLDDWAMRHTGQPIDRDARLALSGTVDRGLLAGLIAHPFFAAPPPKSLDRAAFSLEPLAALSPADGAATLTAFTVAGIAAATRHFKVPPASWIVAGGGAHNPYIVEGLRRVLGSGMMTADQAGFSADFLEAQAFAYLAARTIHNLPSSFPGTTGVREPVVGGVVVSL
jgi:anhydro-N-acetylmuramic acid kinase